MAVPFSKIIQNNNEYDVVDKITQAMIAQAFNAKKTGGYKANDVVIYDNKLYKFTSAHSGAWTGLDVEQVDVADTIKKVDDLKASLAYSTNEIAIGTFNNKTVYRKIYSASDINLAGDTVIDANMTTSYIDTLINMDFVYKNVEGYYARPTGTDTISVRTAIESTGLRIGIANEKVKGYTIVLVYTKA